MSDHALLVPFLDQSLRYCAGVELGMSILSPMIRKAREIRGYFHTDNEEQIRLCCYRMGYEVRKLKPWKHDGKPTGWIFMVLRRRKQKRPPITTT